jgi:WhiB family redox-sensing transcriptional regulator
VRWEDRSRCKGVEGLDFFPEPGVNAVEVKAFCRGCPVRRECAEYAIWGGLTGEVGSFDYGIWGGLSAKQRQHVRAGRKNLDTLLA